MIFKNISNKKNYKHSEQWQLKASASFKKMRREIETSQTLTLCILTISTFEIICYKSTGMHEHEKVSVMDVMCR